MKALVLGLGSIGMRHGRNLRELGISQLHGMDPSKERRQRFESELSGRCFADQEIAMQEAPDLVLVCSPNRFHLQQAKMAARAGCALFVEKPLGTDLEQARSFAKLVEVTGVYAHMGSNWKFHPAFTCMKKWLDEGRVGTVTGVQVLAGQWLPDWHPWEDFRQSYSARKDLGGGAIFDTHELDYLIWLLGPVEEFIGFKAHSGRLPIDTEDVAVSLLRLKSGALATLLTDYIQRTARRRYYISGDKGTMEWDMAKGEVVLDLPEHPRAKVFDAHVEDLNEMYLEQTRHVLKDIRESRKPITPLSHMLDILSLQVQWHSQAMT